MIFVFFIYGLAFFVLGFSILIYPKKGSVFKLASHLYLIAAFGIIHGFNEWVDMFQLISGPTMNLFFDIAHMFLLPVSFLFLIQFGTVAIIELKRKYFLLKNLPVALFGIWIVIFAFSKEHFLMGDIFSRYLLCVPGVFLTVYALILYIPHFEKSELYLVTKHLRLSAVVFLLYAIFAGTIVKKADFFPASVLNYDVFQQRFAFPVQILRASCAAFLAYSMLRILSIFRWETQNVIQENKLRFHTVTSTLPVIIFMENIDRQITFLEGRALDMLGVKSCDFIGQPATRLFPDINIFKQNINATPKEGIYNSRIIIQNLIFDLCYSIVQDLKGKTIGYIGVALDITQRMKIQEELEKLRLEIIRTKHLTELGTISTTIARELSTPIDTTRLLLERLLADISIFSDQRIVKATLEKGLAEVNEANSILLKFCDFAHISSNSTTKPVDLNRLLREAFNICSDSLNCTNLKLVAKDIDIISNLPIPERELEYLIFALIQNAIKTSNPSKKGELQISFEIENKQFQLIFTNTCCNIPQDQIDNIFQSFLNVSSLKKEMEFSLTIVYQIVCSHGGHINVESDIDKGATFYITFPIE